MLQAALRIVWEASLYRVRRREANNILTSVSLLVAFHLPWLDVAYRALFAVVLNIYVYLMNDYFDIELDLASPQKDQAKARYLADHRGAARAALAGLGVLLLGGALLHSWLLCATLIANTVIVSTYSAWLKRWPLVDVVAMGLWGVTMAMVGLPLGEQASLGWRLCALLGILCSSFEIIQVVRDEPGDRATHIMTTAVLLGSKGASLLFRVIVTVAAAHGFLVVGSWISLALLLALLLRLTPQRADRTWDACRLLFGAVWLALMAQTYLGQLH